MHCDGFGSHGIIGDLDREPDQRRLCLVLPSLETDAAALVDLALLVVQEGFGNDTGVKVYQGPAVAVPFLQRSYAFLRYRDLQAFVVLPDPVVGFFVVVLFKEDLPVPVQFFQREEFLCFCFRSKSIDYLVELLDLLSEHSDKRSYPQFFVIRTF